MLKHSLAVAVALALGATVANAGGDGCASYQKMVQTPVPVATAQTPVPSEPVKQEVAAVEVQKPDAPKTN